ncbi:MAG: hypothetical protein CL927_18980 [Deltaproteobacteria bacterium]|nr:hypothetical protein [Deltaproteobacteria bacterium]
MSEDSEGLRRREVDSAWLRSSFKAKKVDRFGAEGWAEVLTYCGFRPLLRSKEGDIADETLARAVARVREAGRQLEAAENNLGAVRGFLPSLAETDWPVLLMAVMGMLALQLPGSTVIGSAMLGGIALIMLIRVLSIRVREPVASETSARKEMAAAVKAMIDSTWVSRVGDEIFENVPQAEHLRSVVARLDHTVDRARVRAEELRRLERELEAVNRSLGGAGDDSDVDALRMRRTQLDGEIEKVEQLRADFQQRLLATEGALERLRLLARRRAVHQRIQQLSPEADALTKARARVEVDLSGFDADVEALAREVVDVEQVLAASVEVAGL